MTEHNNPLMRGNPGRGPGASVAHLQAHCDMLNSMNWVIASGKPYFVSRTVRDSGEVVHAVDRKA